MLLSAATVITMTGNPLSPGMVRVEGGRITDVAPHLDPLPGEEIVDLKDQILLPGLINAHCHLDYTCFKGGIFQQKSFTAWIKQINALKNSFSADDYVKSIQDGFEMLIDSGCTSVFNIEAFPDLMLKLPPPPIRTWWFLELIDLRTRLESDSMLLGALQFFVEKKDWLGGFGLSPHAPYTATVELYRLARQCSELNEMPFTTHLAESVEEQEMFLYGRGSLHDFLETLGRDMSDCGQGSALSHLFDHAVLNDKCLVAHLNYLQAYDWQLIAEQPLHVVHCPRCHQYFQHGRFPLERLQELGCTISIGTDSLASNDMLDLRAEIRTARRNYPHVTSRQWLEMVTTHPAKWIGQPGKLGCIQTGAHADLVAFPAVANSDPYHTVIQGEDAPTLVMVDGKVLRRGEGSGSSSAS